MRTKVEWTKAFFIIVSCFVIIGVVAAFNLYIIPPLGGPQSIPSVLNSDNDGIFFLGHIYQVNVQNRSVSISWLVGGCGNLRLQNAPTFGKVSQCGQANVPLDVYIDNQRQFHYDPTSQPRTSTNVTLFVQDLNQFQHTHIMDIDNLRLLNHVYEHEYFYPLETYGLTTTFIAFNTASNTPLSILSLALSDIVDNFCPFWNETDTLSILNDTSMHSRTTSVLLKRTIGTQVYVAILFLITWILTIAVIYPTVIALFDTPSKIPDGVALLPMMMVLTLPRLRELYPDAPAFGLFLDALGLVLQLSIVSVCAIILLSFIIKVNPPRRGCDEHLKEFDSRTLTDNNGYHTVRNKEL
jgi:hypothetical protein